MSSSYTEFIAFFKDENKLEAVFKGLSLYEAENYEQAIKLFEALDNEFDHKLECNNETFTSCYISRLNNNVISSAIDVSLSFEEENFFLMLARCGADIILATTFNSQTGEKFKSGWLLGKEAHYVKAIKALADVDIDFALRGAIEYGNLKDIESLLERGANPNGSINGLPYVVYAVEESRPKLVKLLGEAGADINAQVKIKACEYTCESQWGKTALHYAVRNANKRIINYLLRKGADPNVEDYAGNLPIFQALEKDEFWEHALLLIKAGADLHVRNKEGLTPYLFLLDSVSSKDGKKAIEIIESMRSNGIDLNETSTSGGNALWYLFKSRAIKAYLAKHGVERLLRPANIYDKSLFENLICAIKYTDSDGFVEIYNGAKERLTDEQKYNLFSLATEYEINKIIDCIINE